MLRKQVVIKYSDATYLQPFPAIAVAQLSVSIDNVVELTLESVSIRASGAGVITPRVGDIGLAGRISEHAKAESAGKCALDEDIFLAKTARTLFTVESRVLNLKACVASSLKLGI